MTELGRTAGSEGGTPNQRGEEGVSSAERQCAGRLDSWTVDIVLVVSQCVETREMLTRYLAWRNFIAMPVHNGAQGLAVCETVLPDAALIDIAVPDPEHVPLIAHIKAQRPNPGLVIVLSSASRRDGEAECRASGADYVLSRPIEFAALARILCPHLLPHDATPLETPVFGPGGKPARADHPHNQVTGCHDSPGR
jgi:CheY-like chemotaxis protein